MEMVDVILEDGPVLTMDGQFSQIDPEAEAGRGNEIVARLAAAGSLIAGIRQFCSGR